MRRCSLLRRNVGGDTKLASCFSHLLSCCSLLTSSRARSWYFGTSAHAQSALALLTATGSTHDLLTSNPGMKDSALFHMYVTGNQGLFSASSLSSFARASGVSAGWELMITLFTDSKKNNQVLEMQDQINSLPLPTELCSTPPNSVSRRRRRLEPPPPRARAPLTPLSSFLAQTNPCTHFTNETEEMLPNPCQCSTTIHK